MIEMDMIFRLSMLVGVLTGGFLVLLSVILVAGVCAWQKFMFKDVCQMFDKAEGMEAVEPYENEY